MQALSVFALLVAWSLATAGGVVPATVLPTPTSVATSLGGLLFDGAFLANVAATVRRTVLASLIAVPSGIAVGFAMGTNDRVKEALGPLIYGLYPMPVVALLPLVALTFGSEQYAIVFLGGLAGFFVLVWNAMSGVGNIDAVYFDVARDNGATSRLQLLREVMLPGALSYLFTGFRLCLSTAMLVVISVEFITARSGLGFFVWRSWQLYELPEMYAGIVVIGAAGVAVTYGLQRLHERLVPWNSTVTDRVLP